MKPMLLLALSACAFAAPSRFMETDALVPEEELMQVPDLMDGLRAQFEQLKSQAGMEVTPGVKKTIDKMITMVNGRIEPAIKSAHNTDQTTLNTDMAAIQGLNDAFAKQEKMLQQDGNNVRKLIDDEQAKSQAWEKQASTFTSSQTTFLGAFDKQTAACCHRDQAAVMSMEYVPAYAQCDYKKQDTSGGCAARAKKAVADVVTAPFSEGLAKYRAARAECAKDTTTLNAAEADTAKQFSACGSAKTVATDASHLAAKEQKRMQAAWDKATSTYAKRYHEEMSKYTVTVARVRKDDKDRTAEWGAAQVIKCMLRAYKAGGKLDKAANDKCAAGIKTKGIVDVGYPKVVKEIKPVLKPFEAQADDSAYEHTCDTRAKSPAFKCPAPFMKPRPSCNPGLAQVAPPAHKHHKGPWAGEVEAKSWKLAVGADAPAK